MPYVFGYIINELIEWVASRYPFIRPIWEVPHPFLYPLNTHFLPKL